MQHEENEISSQKNRLDDIILRLISSISDLRSDETIDNLKRELDTETDIKSVLSRQKDTVTQQLFPIDYKIQELNAEIPLFNAEYEKAKLNSVVYEKYDDVSLLQENLIKVQATQHDLKKQEAEISASVATAQTVTSGLQRSIQANENQLAEFSKDKWRRQVHEQPSVLIEQLSTAIRDLHARAGSRLVQQSPEMQLFLAESSNKLNVILNLQTQDPLKEGRKAYYQLGGMIWTLLDKLEDSSTLDSTFLDEMDHILKQHPLDCREAQEAYRLLKHVYPQELQDMNFGDIMALRVVEYDAISQNLSNSLDQIPNNSPKAWLTLQDSAHDILDAVALQKDQLGGVKERLLNLQFCIQVLNTTQQLVNNPDNPQCQDDFLTLMKANKKGQPSRVKKIVGAMLMFFGAVTALVSLGLVVGTFGFAAPIATFGVGAGAGLLLGGLGLFANGREKGMAKKMANFHLAVDNAQGISNPHSLFAHPVPVMGVIAGEAPQQQGRDPK